MVEFQDIIGRIICVRPEDVRKIAQVSFGSNVWLVHLDDGEAYLLESSVAQRLLRLVGLQTKEQTDEDDPDPWKRNKENN